jgi:hypothetical protein
MAIGPVFEATSRSQSGRWKAMPSMDERPFKMRALIGIMKDAEV